MNNKLEVKRNGFKITTKDTSDIMLFNVYDNLFGWNSIIHKFQKKIGLIPYPRDFENEH